MKWMIAAVFAVVVVGAAWAQTAPALTPEEQALVQAVMALQQSASAACDALPAVKQYTDVLTKANTAFAKSGRTIDWRTGTLAPPKPEAKK